MEKVRLVFIFSRPVSPGFLKILRDAKCVVELNDHRKMTYFSSPDGIKESGRETSKKIISKCSKSTISPIFPNPPEIDDVEMKNEEEEEAPGPVPTSNWNIQNQYALARDQHNDQAQNFVQNNQNRELLTKRKQHFFTPTLKNSSKTAEKTMEFLAILHFMKKNLGGYCWISSQRT
ncbi:unnamed protein product [Caenorhabditis nigoni]